MNKRLIIIDDDPRSVVMLQNKVKPLRFQVVVANDQETAYSILQRNNFDIALVDLRLKADPADLGPDVEVGYATIRYLKERYSSLPVIAVTAYDEKSEVNTLAIKVGADDFWSKKPDGSGENLLTKIRNLLSNTTQEKESSSQIDVPLQNKIGPKIESFKAVKARIKKFAATDATILLLGEPGTGKTFVAREIHDLSQRKEKPFQVLHCPQQNKETFTSELFGHVKGAFTGAHSNRKGLALSANGGTLFFDEIGDLDLECQAIILGFIEDKTIRPLGSDKTDIIDVRIIAATNKNLEKMASEGSFRQDLLDRLSGVVITIPPLKERGASEILRLAKYFYKRFKEDNKGKKKYKDVRVPAVVLQELSEYRYSWPGNVRELRQIITTTLLEVGGKRICLEDFIQRIKSKGDYSDRNNNKLTLIEKEAILSERQNRVFDLIREKGSVRRKDVEELLGCGTTVAWGVLRVMIQNDMIMQEGKGRGARYVLG